MLAFNGFEQRLEIPFAEPGVSFSLNQFEKHRSDHVLCEYLQKNAVVSTSVDQYVKSFKVFDDFLMSDVALREVLIVSLGRRLKHRTAVGTCLDSPINVGCVECNVLYAAATVNLNEFCDL